MKRIKAAFVLSFSMFASLLAFPVLTSAQQPQAMCRETLEAWVRDKSLNARWNSDHTAVIMVRGGVEYICTCPDQNRPPVCRPSSSAASGVSEVKTAAANGPNALVAIPDASKARDAYGRTKLHLAAIEGRRDAAGALVAAGADVNARDNSGATPLHAAAGFGQMAVVDLLLSLGADREAKNNAGDTPLFTAAYWGHLAVVELLIEFGADVNARNMEGLTPLAVAEKQKHTEVATLLKSHGAK